MTDWSIWHRRYDDSDSVQARRLAVVRRRVGESLDALGSSAPRIVSLCSGDGRDLLPELAARPHLAPEVLLVDLDAESTARAASVAAAYGLQRVTVRTADAAQHDSYADQLPVDLLLLCGIFGNVPAEDIRRTVGAVPALLSRGGFVIWTRGRCEGDDLRPAVRRWFVEALLDEISFDGEPDLFGVGVARAGLSPSAVSALPERLFTFLR